MPADRSADSSFLMYPLAHFAVPPAGLRPEWESVYNALRQPPPAVQAIAQLYARAGDHPVNRESLRSWYTKLSGAFEVMSAVMQYLHDRAPRTERVGLAIEAEIAPFRQALTTAVAIPPPPLPRRLWPKDINDRQALDAATAAWREEVARGQWADLGVVQGFDGRPLLDDLRSAVTTENDAGIRLGSMAEKLAVDRLGRLTIKDDSDLRHREQPSTGGARAIGAKGDTPTDARFCLVNTWEVW
jgi:hypothetical protein